VQEDENEVAEVVVVCEPEGEVECAVTQPLCWRGASCGAAACLGMRLCCVRGGVILLVSTPYVLLSACRAVQVPRSQVSPQAAAAAAAVGDRLRCTLSAEPDQQLSACSIPANIPLPIVEQHSHPPDLSCTSCSGWPAPSWLPV
jgi:hypothetical protein